MIPKIDIREFYKEFQQRTGDEILKLVMARIVETPAYVVKELGLEFPPGQDILWGLLIFGKNDLHFFVHATESSLATMFRNATNGRPPREQYLHIPRNTIHLLEPVRREPGIFSPARFLPFLKEKPRLLKISFQLDADPNRSFGLEQSTGVEASTGPGKDSGRETPSHSTTLILEPVRGLEEILPLLEKGTSKNFSF